MRISIISYLTTILLVLNGESWAQSENKFPDLKKKFNEDGSHYIKCSVLGQFWTRYTDLNPGTTLNGLENPIPFDIGIRRLRFNVWSQLTDRIFFYAQFGQNNFSHTSKLYTGAFVHDVVGEYRIHKTALSLGTGLTGWSGLARYAAPSVGSILGVDVPLYQQVTNGITDQFLRKLSVYAKGKIEKLDYRLILSKPMTAINSSSPLGTLNASSATFSLEPPRLQTQGYLNYQFFDQEDNTLGYMVGTYHGKKKILNIGAGWIQQNGALWRLRNTDTIVSAGDTIKENMVLLGADIFLELPLSDKHNAITVYIAYSNYQLGKNYIQNLGVMNPANTVNSNGSLAGAGNAFPIIGTGQTIYGKLAYKLKDDLLKENGTLQLYANLQYSIYEALRDPMIMYESGINWLIHGNHQSKLSFGYQSRPIFMLNDQNQYVSSSRKGMAILQYQISF